MWRAQSALATVLAMSVIFVDPAELYAIAERIGRHADAVRSNASGLAAAIAAERWRGAAADVFAAEAGSVLKDMRGCGRHLDDAADALRRHARRVQGVLNLVRRALADAEGLGAAVVRDVGGYLVDDDGLLHAALADALAGVSG
ncbi:MAG: WXG100 family type VII secretion target [Pseudonocardiales bacterium]